MPTAQGHLADILNHRSRHLRRQVKELQVLLPSAASLRRSWKQPSHTKVFGICFIAPTKNSKLIALFSNKSALKIMAGLRSRETGGKCPDSVSSTWPITSFLMVTIPTGQHERIHSYLDDSVVDQLRGMNITRDEWIGSGSQTSHSKRPGASGSVQGDSTRVTESRVERNSWPTLVIEVGHALPLNGLRLKMRWWFLASSHEAKIVLLAKLYRHLRLIRVEKWRERPYHRTGATMTRAAAAPSAVYPYLDQWVEIQMAPGITETDPARLNPASHVVASDGPRPLRLEFDALLDCQQGPGQGDILFTVQDMQRLAVTAWASVN